MGAPWEKIMKDVEIMLQQIAAQALYMQDNCFSGMPGMPLGCVLYELEVLAEMVATFKRMVQKEPIMG